MNTQNTTSPVGRPRSMSAVMAAFAAVISVSTTFVPPAQATQDLPGGSSSNATPLDIVDIVTERKVQMSRDRIERPWLHL
jgi:hypothetical protein